MRRDVEKMASDQPVILCTQTAHRNAAIRRWAFGIALLQFITGSVYAERVVRVKDGDSIIVASAGREVDVRIADMDAPELGQAYGDEAKSALIELVDGRQVRLELVGGDVYRRIVAHVFLEDRDVAAAMVERGLAWVRRAYVPASRLISLEDQARIAHKGLWSDPDPTPPWVWRKFGNQSQPVTPECGTKTRCAEMDTCEEAIAYLHTCDVDTIDGDGDGIPCESLCRYYR